MIRVDDFNEEELSIIRDILFIFNGNLRSVIVRKAQIPHKTNLEALNICLCKNRENSFNCPTNCPDSKEYGIFQKGKMFTQFKPEVNYNLSQLVR